MPRIQHKRGTSANLASVNPTPLAGELVWDSTENAIKIGDGATAWTSLAYVTATPRSHVHDGGEITTGTVAYARLPVGSTSSTVCAGDDARLTDARTPTAHKSTHATGGSDALSPADIGAAPAANATLTTPILSGNVDLRNGGAGDYALDVVSTATTGTAVLRAAQSGLGNNGFTITTDGSHHVYSFANSGGSLVYTSTARLGVGTVTPASRLDVNGAITVSATSGSAGTYLPSLTFSGDANTGFGQVSGQSDTASIFTAGHERVRVGSTGMTQFFSPISIGIAPAANIGFYNYVSIAGSGSSGIVGTLNLPNITGTTTGDARLYDAACNLNGSVGNLYLFKARASISGTGTVTNEVVGFESENLPSTFGTAQIGFQSKLSSGAGRWNIYAGGTAQNYFAGNVGIGATVPDTKLHVVGGSKFVGPITEGYVSGGNTGSAKTIALTNGTVQAFTLTGNCTFTMPTAVAGQSFTVLLKTGAGSYTATFTSVKWPGDTAPTITTTASKMDILSFVSDGTNWYGSISQNYGV